MIITFDSAAAEQLKIPLDLAVAIVLYDHGVELTPGVLEELKGEGLLIGNHVSDAIIQRLNGDIKIPSDLSGAFEELLKTYPEFDHLRPLHDTSEKLKSKYLRKVTINPGLHKEVLASIDREKRYRAIRLSRGEFVEAWKSLSKYIDTEGWNRYLKDLPEERVVTGTGYGEQEL